MQACMVSPCPHPARRYRTPNSSPVRKGSAGFSPVPSNPMADLASTNEMLRSNPQALAQVGRSVLRRREINPYVVVPNLYGENACLVGKLVKGSTAL